MYGEPGGVAAQRDFNLDCQARESHSEPAATRLPGISCRGTTRDDDHPVSSEIDTPRHQRSAMADVFISYSSTDRESARSRNNIAAQSCKKASWSLVANCCSARRSDRIPVPALSLQAAKVIKHIANT